MTTATTATTTTPANAIPGHTTTAEDIPAAEQRVIEYARQHKPEGAPPPETLRRKNWPVAAVVVVLAFAIMVSLAYWLAGPIWGTVLVITALVAYTLGAAPALYAAAARRRDLREAEQAV